MEILNIDSWPVHVSIVKMTLNIMKNYFLLKFLKLDYSTALQSSEHSELNQRKFYIKKIFTKLLR